MAHAYFEIVFDDSGSMDNPLAGSTRLEVAKELFEKDFPDVEILPIDAYPQGNALIGEEETARLVKQSGVDAVIIGNAA